NIGAQAITVPCPPIRAAEPVNKPLDG
ncbi:MAG: hypothetical protein ACJA0H_000629, partial [Francisellaceae bacterium]